MRARFDQSNEKASYVIGENQMSLFNEAEKYQNCKEEGPIEEAPTVQVHARKKKKTIDEVAKNLAVESMK